MLVSCLESNAGAKPAEEAGWRPRRRAVPRNGTAERPSQEHEMSTWQTLVAGIALMVAGIIILKPRQPKAPSRENEAK